MTIHKKISTDAPISTVYAPARGPKQTTHPPGRRCDRCGKKMSIYTPGTLCNQCSRQANLERYGS